MPLAYNTPLFYFYFLFFILLFFVVVAVVVAFAVVVFCAKNLQVHKYFSWKFIHVQSFNFQTRTTTVFILNCSSAFNRKCLHILRNEIFGSWSLCFKNITHFVSNMFHWSSSSKKPVKFLLQDVYFQWVNFFDCNFNKMYIFDVLAVGAVEMALLWATYVQYCSHTKAWYECWKYSGLEVIKYECSKT